MMMDKKNFLSFVATEETVASLGPKTIKMNHKAKNWKPSELETAILKIQFQTNQHPTLDEQEAILKHLRVRFDSQVRLDQLTQWFMNEQERTFNKPSRACKNSYKKFQKEDIDHLTQSFSQNNYPNLTTMTAMAEQMDCSLSKIENWYKHNRRLLSQQGYIKFKARKYFKKDELNYLLNLFNMDPCPNKQKMIEIAERLNCDRYQIKNWYSNRRKKFRILDRKSNCHGIDITPQPVQEIYLSSPESQPDDLYLGQETPQQYTIEELVPPSPSDHIDDAFVKIQNHNPYEMHTQGTAVPQNIFGDCTTTESTISQELFSNQVLSTESSDSDFCSAMTPPMRDQSSNTENRQAIQIIPQNNQSQIFFQPFGNYMHQGMIPFNHMNAAPGNFMLQPMPAQNMISPFVHYPNTWQQTVADAPFGSYAQPSKKIFVMGPAPMNVMQNPVQFVMFY